MKVREQLPEDSEPAAAIEVRPESIVTRSASRWLHVHRLLFAGSVALLASGALVWFLTRPTGQAAGSGRRIPTVAQFRLPPLDWPVPKAESAPAAAPPAGAPAFIAEGEVPSQGSLSSPPRTGASAPVPADGVGNRPREWQDDAPVLWRSRQDPAPGVTKETDEVRHERSLLASGYDPARATQLPPATHVLAKGTAVGCTLQTAIESQLAGLVTCLIGTAVYGADGLAVLLPRGTQLLGEARSEARSGQSRVYVLWVEARTPGGVLVPLGSPATDALGRAGVPGQVDTHFFERFGAAMLISVLDAGVQLAATRDSNGTVVVEPQSSAQVLTEVLRNTVAIPPTISVRPGAHLSVMVARDVDFGSTPTTEPLR